MIVAPEQQPRTHLRLGLALIAAIDTISIAQQLAGATPGPRSHPHAPALLLALAGQPLVVAALTGLGLAALVQFARARHTLRAGGLALAVLALLSESLAAVAHGPSRPYFFVGAMLLGWLLGTAVARAAHRPGLAGLAAEQRLAEAGAIAALAAIYSAAGLSKLLHSGVSWADERTLRAIVLTHHRISDDSPAAAYAHFVAARPRLGQAMAIATLVVQLGAPLYLVGPRLRALWGALILGFHLHITVLTGIGYAQAKLLTLLFSFPWPQLLARLRGRPTPTPTPTPDPPRAARAMLVTTLLVLAAALLAWASPITRYTALHHAERARAAP